MANTAESQDHRIARLEKAVIALTGATISPETVRAQSFQLVMAAGDLMAEVVARDSVTRICGVHGRAVSCMSRQSKSGYPT